MASSSGSHISITVGILTVSDRCHAGVMTDTSGPNLSHLVQTLINNGVVADLAIVPDEEKDIKDKLLQWCDKDQLNVIFTSGGTGFAQRDITPEVTKSVIHKEAPGMMVAMLKASLDVTPMAMLSRPVCGIRNKTVIINLPGSKKGSEECFRFVLPALSHAVNLVRGDNQDVRKTHEVVQSGSQNTFTEGGSDAEGQSKTPENTTDDPDNTHLRGDYPESPGFDNTHVEQCSRYNLQQSINFLSPPLTCPTMYNISNSQNITDSIHPPGQTFHVHKMPRTQAQKKLYALPLSNLGDMIIDSSNSVSVDGGPSSVYYNQNEIVKAYPSQDIVMLENTKSELNKGTEEHDDPEIMSDGEKEDNQHSVDGLTNSSNLDQGVSSVGNEDIQETVSLAENDVNLKHDKESSKDPEQLNKDSEIITECAQALFEMSQQGNTDNGANVTDRNTGNDLGSNDNGESTCKEIDSNDKNANETSRKRYRVLSTKPKRHHRDAEVCFAQVGASAKIWTMKHPQINGIYLNKGKREIKKHLVQLKRQPTAVDKSSYLRNGRVNDRNRIDDYFEFTDEGKAKREKFEEGLVRDEYVVNWYMWCPGHYNCLRQCGGYGKCVEGCSGSKHKQDRHNCSLMINWKLYLSDLDRWMIQITGSHVPVGSNVQWQTTTNKDRLDEDTRDLILKYSERSAPNSKIEQLLAKELPRTAVRKVPTIKQISRFVFNRRRKRNISNQNVRESLGNDENTRNYSEQIEEEGITGNDTEKEEMVIENSNKGATEKLNEENGNAVIIVNDIDDVGVASCLTDDISSANIVPINTSCTDLVPNPTNSNGYVYTYFEQPQISTIFNSGANFVNSSQDQGVFNLYSAQKVSSENIHSVMMDQQQFNQLPNSVQFQTNNIDVSHNDFTQIMPNSCSANTVAVTGNDITNVLTNQCVPPLGQESSLTGSQSVQILSQIPSNLNQVQVMTLDSEGQPMYRNYGDIQSLIPGYQQSPSI